MVPEEVNHRAFVEAWLDRAGRSQAPAQLVYLLERAVGALWRRAHVTLGEVTLTAIVDRVLYTTAERYAFLSVLKIEETGIRFDELRAQGAGLDDGRLGEAVRDLLVELLTVLGNLTDEILTPALHAALSEVGRDGDAHGASS